MTKVLIMSDSHGLTEEVSMIKARHDIKFMIHCGDSELDLDADEMDGFYKVAGNCDFDARYPDEQTIQLNDLTFYVTHGHLHHVKMGLLGLSYRAAEEKANVICFGHTHIAGVEQIDKQLFINPGSIRSPRNRQEKTYAIMEWDSPASVTVNFYTVNGDMLEDLAFHATI
ncbi:YfcE family phosphodiesterase [Oceanobacillus damuensis]|uniref:YfcE family phosphodiesterase n=1 Tax=Oceanobacillus damuensis TaxID=937928 RepID=UPI00082D1EAB|nr:metallophosphoesterase [Oceanobacillus damuensis]